MKRALIVAISLVVAGRSLAQAPRQEDFGRHATLAMNGAGPFYQLVLPLAVYQGMRRADLADLRVFNGRGEVVPHALIKMHGRTESEQGQFAPPLFPIIGSKDSQAAGIEVNVRRHGDDTLVAVRQGAPVKAGEVVQGVVMDLSHPASGNLERLQLKLGPSATPFHPYTLEASDDLQHWRTVSSGAQLVVLEHEGQRIENSDINLAGGAGKYLRLLWSEPSQAPAINGATVRTSVSAMRPAPLTWTAALAPQAGAGPAYVYPIDGQFPLERLRVNLPEANSLVTLSVEHYLGRSRGAHAEDQWGELAQAVVYRLNSPQGEVKSPDLAIDRGPVTRLRLALDKRNGGIGAQAPTLQIGFTPDVLVFLARGEGPFSLAWRAPEMANAALAAGTLIPGYQPGAALTASVATLGEVQVSAEVQAPEAAAAAAPASASKGVLWVVLVLGVLVLGAMAAMLFKQMKAPDQK